MRSRDPKKVVFAVFLHVVRLFQLVNDDANRPMSNIIYIYTKSYLVKACKIFNYYILYTLPTNCIMIENMGCVHHLRCVYQKPVSNLSSKLLKPTKNANTVCQWNKWPSRWWNLDVSAPGFHFCSTGYTMHHAAGVRHSRVLSSWLIWWLQQASIIPTFANIGTQVSSDFTWKTMGSKYRNCTCNFNE